MAALQTKLPKITLLTDPDLKATAAWGALYPSSENPTPSTFIVRGGVIRFRHVEQEGSDWPTYTALAAALDRP